MSLRLNGDDHAFMQRALRLAAAATRRAAPNPGVGCVLVRAGQIIGEGATLQVGGDHAEIQAIKDCYARGLTPAGATAYVTLEPCSHHGRTPPCAERLIKEGVARVVAAMVDPYHEVAGRGIALLNACRHPGAGRLPAGRGRARAPWFSVAGDAAAAVADAESRRYAGRQNRAAKRRQPVDYRPRRPP